MKEIKTKIERLGGVQPNVLCEISIDKDYKKSLADFEDSSGIKLPESYTIFYTNYGPVSFNKMVEVECLDIFPFIDEGNKMQVDYFMSMDEFSPCSIKEARLILPEELFSILLPVCEGEPGDLIGIRLDEENFGKIYYWHHEGGSSNELFFIADSFDNFIMKLRVRDEEDFDQSLLKDAKLTATPQLLDLLAKSGYGPKKE